MKKADLERDDLPLTLFIIEIRNSEENSRKVKYLYQEFDTQNFLP